MTDVLTADLIDALAAVDLPGARVDGDRLTVVVRATDVGLTPVVVASCALSDPTTWHLGPAAGFDADAFTATLELDAPADVPRLIAAALDCALAVTGWRF